MAEIKKRFPVICPSCHGELTVKKFLCPACEVEIEGRFALPALAKLSAEDQEFILQFVTASGSLKEMARIRGLSYPTVRNQLDEIIERLKNTEKTNSHQQKGEPT
jgi:hypothetical protein